MRRGFLLTALLMLVAGSARAEAPSLGDVWERAQAATQSIFGLSGAEPGVMRAPREMDSEMVLTPPKSAGTMRLIRPPLDRNAR